MDLNSKQTLLLCRFRLKTFVFFDLNPFAFFLYFAFFRLNIIQKLVPPKTKQNQKKTKKKAEHPCICVHWSRLSQGN